MPKINPLPERALLLDLFAYDMDSGALTYRRRPAFNSRRREGDEAGTLHHSGYLQVKVGPKLYQAHRLIWMMQTGANPVEIDHRNRVRNDNRWSNLREATRSQQGMNKSVKNPHRGVHFIAARGLYGAQIKANGEHTWLGCYLLPEDACRAYRAAAAAMHGEFIQPGACGCH